MEYTISRPKQNSEQKQGIDLLVEKPLWKLSDIILEVNVEERLKHLLAFMSHRETLLIEWEFRSIGFLNALFRRHFR